MNNQDIKVLIVEDEPLVAEDIRIKLEQLGYTVTGIAGSGEEAINCAAETRPDLVLMDIVLRGAMDGIQAAESIRYQYGTPVIYLTAYTDQDFLNRAKITEPLAYLVKPCTERDLLAALTVAIYKAESERQARERNLLDATLVSLSDALIAWNLDGKVIRVNHALLNLFGVEEKDLLGQEVSEAVVLTNADTGQPVTEELIYLAEKRGVLKDERDLLLMCHDQRLVAVRVSGSRILDDRRQLLGYAMLIHDDTERNQHEMARRESEARFRQLADHLESIFSLSDLQTGKVIYLSQAYETIYGLKTQNAIDNETLFLNNVYPQDREKAQSIIRSIYAQNSCEETFRITRPDGALRWVNARCYPVKEPDSGEVYRIACIIDDVTERKEATSKLNLDAKIFENTAEGILITDPDLKIIAINNAFTQVTGYSIDDVQGMTPRILNSGYQDRAFYECMWNSINTTGHWQGEIYNRRKNAEIYPEWMTINAIHDNEGNVLNYFAIFSDISAIKKSQEKLDYLAHRDHLTGFANRLLFGALLEHTIEQAERDNEKVTVLLMDLDRFKSVNDSLGHETGDLLLKMVAERLRGCLREEDTLARLGGDEFIFILEGLKGSSNALWIAQKIQEIFTEPFLLAEREIMITASMGISIYPNDGLDAVTLVKHADMAMYKAKQQGKNRCEFYTEDLNTDSIHLLILATQMRQGLERNEFVVYYQPQVSLQSGEIIGFEALVRWRHPEKGLVPPAQFIPLAEETGFIETLGEWVLYESCRQCKAWQATGHDFFLVAVNLSAGQFIYSDIVSTVRDALEKTGLEGRYLELEITESCLVQHVEQVLNKLEELKAMGVSLSIDDFGTGYSSLSYLKRFPIDKLKIDRSFVMNLPDDLQDCAISNAIIAMGKSLGMTVIAEGTETIAQRNFLSAQGCDEMQGYLFSMPLPADEIEKLYLRK